MGERFIINAKNGVGFRVGQGERSVERFRFVPQQETIQKFLIGGNRPEDNRLTMTVNNRTEVLHRHEPGYQQRKLKVLSIGAHPDDTALSEGLEHVLVEQGRKEGRKDTGLAVISLSPGQANGDKDVRIGEDIQATERLGADLYINLGFEDGNLPAEKKQMMTRLKYYLQELQPDIIILPDPEDKSHADHVAVAETVVEALRENQQLPIVAYADHQFGDNEIQKGAFGFVLTDTHHRVWEDAFLMDHPSQTAHRSTDVQQVVRRPRDRAVQFSSTEVFLGIGRQDLEFSQVPISNFLGYSAVELTRPENDLSISLGPFIIFDHREVISV